MAALPNLVAYSERMHRRYFGERPPGGAEPLTLSARIVFVTDRGPAPQRARIVFLK